jgi:glycosyltransferase involved in cell wall biosynthesis
MVEYLSKELVRMGHEVHVLHNPVVYSILRNAKHSVQMDSTDTNPVLHGFSGSSRMTVLMTLSFDMSGGARDEVRRLAKEVKADVLHWHNTKGFIGRPFSLPGTKSLYTSHDYYLVCPRSNLAKPDMSFCTNPKNCLLCVLRWKKPPQFWRAGRSRVIRLPKEMTVLCPSEYVSRRIGQDGITQSRLLRNFVPDRRASRTLGQPLRESLVYVGMLEPHKGPQILLEAFARSKDRHGFLLHIVGEGSIKEVLRMRTKALHLEKRVAIPGFINRSAVESILADAAALVVPSQWPENAPLTALESFAMGVPVVGSDQGGLPEILGEESGSMMFAGGDVDALANAIVSIWIDRQNLETRSRKARMTYEQRYSPEVHMAQFLRIVDDRLNPSVSRQNAPT